MTLTKRWRCADNRDFWKRYDMRGPVVPHLLAPQSLDWDTLSPLLLVGTRCVDSLYRRHVTSMGRLRPCAIRSFWERTMTVWIPVPLTFDGRAMARPMLDPRPSGITVVYCFRLLLFYCRKSGRMRLRPALCSVGGIKGLLMPRNQVSDVSNGRQIFFGNTCFSWQHVISIYDIKYFFPINMGIYR